MNLKAQMVLDSINAFLDLNGVAENVTYTPKGAFERTIPAYVERSNPLLLATDEREESTRNFLVSELVVFVSTDPTKGVGTVTPNFDFMMVPVRIGETPTKVKVVSVESNTPGMWTLRVRR